MVVYQPVPPVSYGGPQSRAVPTRLRGRRHPEPVRDHLRPTGLPPPMNTLAPTKPSAAAELEARLEALQTRNLGNAQIAAGAITMLVERLGSEALASADLELARKTVDTLLKVAVHPEKQAAADKTAAAASAILQIVLDDTPQVPPPKKKRALTNVEDAVEVVPLVAAAHAPSDAPWGDI